MDKDIQTTKADALRRQVDEAWGVFDDEDDRQDRYIFGTPPVGVIVTAVLIGLLAAGLMLALIVHAAHAHDAEAFADPQRAQWFDSLKQPGSTAGCCNVTDCRQTKAEQKPDGNWRAILTDYRGERWIDVPPGKVLKRPLSIDGEAYICNTSGTAGGQQYFGSGEMANMPPADGTVLCFIPPIPGF